MWCSEPLGLARRGVVLGLAAGMLFGCGFQPLYAPGAPATAMLGEIEVAVIEGEPGFAMRERLTERLGPAHAAEYRLVATLDLKRTGVALTQQDYTTRYNVTGISEFQLVPVGGGAPVLTGEVRSFTGYSAPDSETASAFASASAERDAELRLARTLADEIIMRLAVTAKEWSGPAVQP